MIGCVKCVDGKGKKVGREVDSGNANDDMLAKFGENDKENDKEEDDMD